MLSEADIINVLGWDEEIDIMEYMVEYLMKPIDKKDEHTELNLNLNPNRPYTQTLAFPSNLNLTHKPKP